MPQRKLLRHKIIQHRKKLSEIEQRISAQQITQHITCQHEYSAALHIAFYQAFNGEVNTDALLQHAYSSGKHCYLPVLDPIKHNHLLFMPYQPGDALIQNKFGIYEPKLNVNKVIEPCNLDIVCMPLVAFDENGNRLGMGQGYYDRSFAFMLNQHRQHPLLIGLAYEWQKESKLKAESWDVPLSAVASEKHFYRFTSSPIG